MKRLVFCCLLLVLPAACTPFPEGLDTGGNAPLVVNLDDESPIEIGEENGATVRGPHKGIGERGGIAGSFLGVGGPMCVVIDPEGDADDDNYLDHGDADLTVGRAADYTGTPGRTVGEFSGEYVDALGVEHTLDQNLCIQIDLFGLPGAHAGAAKPEYCSIETDVGVPYILQAETFSVPPDDEMLTVAVIVLNGVCPPEIDDDFIGD